MNSKGFSLVSVMVGAALLGGLSLIAAQVFKNINQGQNQVMAAADEMNLRSGIEIILGTRKFCTASFGGYWAPNSVASPLSFKKADIDENDEGLETELWLSNQNGSTRTQKKFSSTESPFNKFGKITIESIKLIMNNGTGYNYTESPNHSDMGEVLVSINKPISSTTDRTLILRFPIVVKMKTDSSGNSTILSCSSAADQEVNFSTGVTPVASNGSGDCNSTSSSSWLSLANIGADRKCFSFIEQFSKTYRYNSAACTYDETSGDIKGCSHDNRFRCRWVCFD